MKNIRLLPVVIMAVAALLVLKTIGLVTDGGYVLTGVQVARAAGGGSAPAPAAEGGEAPTLPGEHTIEETTPTLDDATATVGDTKAGGGHGAPAAEGEGEEAHADEAIAPVSNSVEVANECAPKPVLAEGEEPSEDGELTVVPGDCPPLQDALPQILSNGQVSPLGAGDTALTEQALLERLSTRRGELENYEQDLAMRASLVEAAEARIEERQQTLQGIEDQIASLVEQRKEMEEGQFAGIVAMYETMKPKDAAKIFNALDIEVLLRVAKMMSPRKMAPILAEMDTVRAQELTVRMASASQDPLDSMAPEDLAALPQIVGQ
ncbi:MotE family protein [Devosia aurantiaca]|uniref:Magnesium transporter MgtE intracellular domain-containing protein n=1 Tax=Devosia aurantiaca TaxID=2714858 RepID=A0A6M1SZ63_9HYPH|nr:hypothetical protein [Devosia aurantiaca]NGP17951.1 hypothetical protein [Devosia aurantiaca]